VAPSEIAGILAARSEGAANCGCRLRRQALDLLQAECATWSKALDRDDSESRSSVARTVRHWQGDADLAGVSDPDALAKPPEAERTARRAHRAKVDRTSGGGRQGTLSAPDRALAGLP
jgi:hypothetical protein